MSNDIRYELPDGRIVSILYDVCRAASTVDYTLISGRIATAVICAGER